MNVISVGIIKCLWVFDCINECFLSGLKWLSYVIFFLMFDVWMVLYFVWICLIFFIFVNNLFNGGILKLCFSKVGNMLWVR